MNDDASKADASLDTLLTLTPNEKGQLVATIPAGWNQGLGLFGGLVAAFVTSALERGMPDLPLRSLTLEICGPVQPGEAELAVEVLREGSKVVTKAVRLVQGGQLLAHAVGVLGLARAPDLRPRVEATAPTPPPWRDIDLLPVGPPLGPAFATHFEFRNVGAYPFAQSVSAVTAGWVRPKATSTRRDAAFLALCADAYWPTQLTIESAPRPMATIAFTLQPFVDLSELSADAPLFHTGRLIAQRDGYVVEHRELWTEDGRLVALNQQTFVVIK